MSVASFNCTQCGAGLDALGGGRVRAHICSYCGAELDAQDDYKVLAQFRDMERPETPFILGMEGRLWDVGFTVIGTIAWVEYHAGKSWHWVDHQIYSPTHGYGWLTVENGFVTYARKVRQMPVPAHVPGNVIENSEHRPTVKMLGRTFRYYGSGHAKPTFIEGEFNYRPTLDESIRYVSLLSDTQMLDIVETVGEREYEISLLPDQKATLTSFNVPLGKRPKPRGIHPLQPFQRSSLELFVRNLAFAGATFAALLAISFSTAGETIASSGQVRASKGLSLPFEVTQPDRLTQIEVYASVNNSWAWIEAELTDDEDEPVAEFEHGVEYYHGSDWSEGNQTVKTRLYLAPGAYTLTLAMPESEADWPGGRAATQIAATVRQGVMNTLWLWAAMAVLALIGALFLLERGLHHKRRWSGSDWSDD